MRARKIAISISNDALETVDRQARAEGISRSAWFERAVQQARRQAALRLAVRQSREIGLRQSSEPELESIRIELSKT